jgi:hypothetical protein
MYRAGQNHIYIRCIYGIFGREITKHTVIYGAYIRYTVLANPIHVSWFSDIYPCMAVYFVTRQYICRVGQNRIYTHIHCI